MARGGISVGRKGSGKRRSKSVDKGSDDSDEDYVLGEDETDNSEDFSGCSSEDASEESFDYDETSCKSEEEREKKVIQSKPRKRVSGRKRSTTNSRRKGRISDEDEEDEDEDDEEFIPGVDDGIDDEEEKLVRKKKTVRKGVGRRKRLVKQRKTKQKSKVSKKKELTQKRRRLVARKPVAMSSDDDFVHEDLVVHEKVRKKVQRSKKRVVVRSDSDFGVSESSDFEYTISEDEIDLVMEMANSGNSMGFLRNSLRPKRLRREVTSNPQQQKSLTKEEEKAKKPKLVTEKQMCGICLSEERRTKVRGTLDCCAHFFCFTCIMEWAKVESRCPVCKQRFQTVSKPARSDIGIGLRETVIKIPICNQVYRPPEEEISVYVDPYADTVCVECLQGGDDNLMLLCDICDSSAHTYCVGLGREVPEGNWYCEGCRFSDPGSSTSPVQESIPDQGTNTLGLCPPSGGMDAEGSDVAPSISLVEQSYSRGWLGVSAEFAEPDQSESAALVSEAMTPTVSGRRRLRYRINRLLSNSRMREIYQAANQIDVLPHARLGGGLVVSEAGQDNMASEHVRILESGRLDTYAVEGGVRETDLSTVTVGGSLSSSVPNIDPVFPRLGYSRREVGQATSNATSNGLRNETLDLNQETINSLLIVSDHEQRRWPASETSANNCLHMHNEVCGSGMMEGAKEQVRKW